MNSSFLIPKTYSFGNQSFGEKKTHFQQKTLKNVWQSLPCLVEEHMLFWMPQVGHHEEQLLLPVSGWWEAGKGRGQSSPEQPFAQKAQRGEQWLWGPH